MIIYELNCGEGHRFEGWFASADDFARQSAAGLVTCPVCGGADVAIVPSARVAVHRDVAHPAPEPAPAPAASGAPGRRRRDHGRPAARGVAASCAKSCAQPRMWEPAFPRKRDASTMPRFRPGRSAGRRRPPRPRRCARKASSSPRCRHFSPANRTDAGAGGPAGLGVLTCRPFGGPLAQLVEQRTFNPLVAGSSPARPTTEYSKGWREISSPFSLCASGSNAIFTRQAKAKVLGTKGPGWAWNGRASTAGSGTATRCSVPSRSRAAV